MRTPLLRWLSLRVRILCVVAFIIGGIVPPYVPKSALADDNAVSSVQFLFVEEGFLMKSSSLGEQGSRLAFNEGLIYTVKAGDTVEKIAAAFQIKPDTIRWANNLADKASLEPNQELIILPVDGVMHTVRKGQTLERIATLYGVSQEEIARQNKIQGGFIIADQQLIIPGAKPIGDLPPAIASAGGTLRFTERLPARDIQLKLRQLNEQGARAGTTGVVVPKTKVSATPTAGILQMPCANCFYTQYYHPGHYAVDIQTRGGGPIFASEAGTVIRAETSGWNGGYGNVVEVDHGNGLVTLYAHNKEVYVKVGDKVERGQQIAWMGNTGLVYGATGIHTHFEVRVNGDKKNPLLYLE